MQIEGILWKIYLDQLVKN